MSPIDPEMERHVRELEEAADRFATAIANHPGEADALWLRVNRLRDRILYGWAEARDEARRIRLERIAAHEQSYQESAA